MGAYILRRLLSVAVTFIIVSLVIFFMMHAIPGGPFDANDMPVSAAVREKLIAVQQLAEEVYLSESDEAQ